MAQGIKPGTDNKTGGWRARKPIVDEKKCIGCYTCERDCPDGTIKVGKNKKAKVDYENCKGCGICANECPVKAIKMEDEK